MGRRTIWALGVVPATILLLALTGCSSTSDESAGNRDGGAESDDGALSPEACNGGCVCFSFEACPAGCYPSSPTEAFLVDGAPAPAFCSNTIAACNVGWSTGGPANCDPSPVMYLDSGSAPRGAFCCNYVSGGGGE